MESEKDEFQNESNRLERIAQLGPIALISISSSEQARLLADLKKAEVLKGMSDIQILALAVEHSPNVAYAFQERIRAADAWEIDQQVRELYERILSQASDNT